MHLRYSILSAALFVYVLFFVHLNNQAPVFRDVINRECLLRFIMRQANLQHFTLFCAAGLIKEGLVSLFHVNDFASGVRWWGKGLFRSSARNPLVSTDRISLSTDSVDCISTASHVVRW